MPNAVSCIDRYHIVEKRWEAGGCLHSEGSEGLAAWVAEQQRRLRRGDLGVFATELTRAYSAIPITGPGNKGRRRRLLDILALRAR